MVAGSSTIDRGAGGKSRGDGFDSAEVLGTWRSLEPPGALLHMATRVDALSAANEFEAEVDVELLNVDATSYRQLRTAAGGDPREMASLIARIVSEHGKMQNPATGSGGVVLGRLSGAGASYRHRGSEVGERVIPLASLIAVPLRLDSVGPVDPRDPQVPVSGRAVVTGRMALAPVPGDLPVQAVITAIDVYPAASHVRSLARPEAHVVVLGSGHAGLAAAAAARERVGPGGLVTVVDSSAAALENASRVDPAAATLQADATDPLAVTAGLGALGLPKSDLTVLSTNVPGCEGTAILLTSDEGTVLFFSTATSFPAAALGADAMSSTARLAIPNGYTEDRGTYLLALLRRNRALLAALETAAPR